LSLCPNNSISHHGKEGTETITGDRNIVAGAIISPLEKATTLSKKN
jgi:hypothetical protein